MTKTRMLSKSQSRLVVATLRRPSLSGWMRFSRDEDHDIS